MDDGPPRASRGARRWPRSLLGQTRLCTIPVDSVVAPGWDSGSMVMEARILRTLHWFGLLDYKREAIEGQRFGERHFYRKTKLFDRFLSFDVTTAANTAIRH